VENLLVHVDEEEVERTISSQASNHSIDYQPFGKRMIGEPFELYGGNFTLAENEKQRLAKDRVYRFYEAKLIEQNFTIQK